MDLRWLEVRQLATLAQEVNNRIRQRNGLLHGLLDFYGCLQGPLRVSLFLAGFFLGVVLTFLTAAGDASLLPCALAYLFYCLDDRAHRRHIYSIPLQCL